jgi:hypothetical protein
MLVSDFVCCRGFLAILAKSAPPKPVFEKREALEEI